MKIHETCQENNIPYHIFLKRETENYIPENILEMVTLDDNKAKKTFNAYLNLSSTQKDHYDMKEGFSKNGANEHKLALYENLDKKIIKDLKKGFGNIIGQAFQTHIDSINKKNICERCESTDEKEILNLLNIITEII